jgi:two-component system response regulator YesN
MKVLIVDDEKHVRDAIRLLVDWAKHGIDGILEAPEGETAVRILEAEKPEIVFTDMRMPIMDGVGLLEWIHEHHPSCKTIVVSGHDDFDFVRHTVKYGGLDYILKPIDPDELDGALAKAVDAWKRENEARLRDQIRAIQINEIKPVYWDRLFSGLIADEAAAPALPAQFGQEFGLPVLPGEARVAVMTIDTMPRAVRGKFGSDLDLLFFSLANIANEYLHKDRAGHAFRNWNSRSELIIVCWRDMDGLQERIRRINEGFRTALGGSLDAGIGSAARFPAGLGESYREAAGVLRQRNLLGKAGKMLTHDPAGAPRFTPLPFSRHEAGFRAAVAGRRESLIREAVDRWIDDVRALDAITPEQLELWNHEYAVFKTRCLSESLPGGQPGIPGGAGEDAAFIFPLDDDGALSLPLLKETVTRDLLRLSAELARLAQRERNIIRDIVDYIERHYHEDISLQHIADRFFLSREYISRKFKQELDENISDFITRIRIGKAKQLLGSPGLRIADIAEMIGYHDEKYFSKVFKKNVGLSPTDYRKAILKDG